MRARAVVQLFYKTLCAHRRLASYADVLRLVKRFSPRTDVRLLRQGVQHTAKSLWETLPKNITTILDKYLVFNNKYLV